MRVLICGGRDYADEARVHAVLGALHRGERGPIEMLVNGGAPGADALGRQWAEAMRVPGMTVSADWSRYGRRAGPLRNARMLAAKPDLVVAFPGGRGTANMISQARAAGVEVLEVTP